MSELLTLDENPRLQFTSAGFRWRTTVDWNNLPLEIREIGNLPLFKKKVTIWIREKRAVEPG